MKLLFALLPFLAMCQQALAKCDPSGTDRQVDLHWSDNSVTTDPGCSASIEVRADPKGNAAATVYLRKEGIADVQLPFNVFRDGTLYWEKTGKRVAFQDAYSYGVYRFWLVDVGAQAMNAPHSILADEALRSAVKARLGKNQNVARFWPDLAAWLPDSVLLTVRIQTLVGKSGPLAEHCLGFLVSTVHENQILAVSDVDLHSRYKAGCEHNEK